MKRTCLLAAILVCGSNCGVATDLLAQVKPDIVVSSELTSEAFSRLARVLMADNPDEYSWRVRELFSSMSRSDIRAMKKSPNVSLAIQSSWEEVIRQAHEGPEDSTAESVSEFISGFARTTGVAPPEWWNQVLRQFDHSSNIPGAESNRLVVGRYARQGSFNFVSNAISVSEWNDTVISGTLSGREFKVNGLMSVYASELGLTDGLTAKWVTNDRVAIASYGDLGGGYLLAVCSADTGTIDWVQDVWVGPALGGGSGTGHLHHYAEVISKDDLVVVFGFCMNTCYAEGFSISQGRSVFRFGTGYCQPSED